MSRGRVWPVVVLLVAVGVVSMVISTTSVSPGRADRVPGLPLCAGHGTTTGPVPGWRMGAVQFLSPTHGVGITLNGLICFDRSRTGSRLAFRSQPVRLAVSSDGGRTWRLSGVAAPIGPAPSTWWSSEQLAAASPRRLWAIVGRGRLLVTYDGGANWARVRVRGPAIEVTRTGAALWALTCPRAPTHDWPLACRPLLWRAAIGTGEWARVPLPELSAQDSGVEFSASSERDLVLDLLSARREAVGEMAISTDGGAKWRIRPNPSWDRHPCSNPQSMTAAGPHTFWLLCLGGAAAGSSTKGLLESTDAGRTWRTVAALTTLLHRPPPESLPSSEPDALAAGSSERLWLSLTNGLAESGDAGKRWTNLPSVFDPGGWPTTLAILDARHAWLLAPGAGLWSTRDGQHWSAVGPLHTH